MAKNKQPVRTTRSRGVRATVVTGGGGAAHAWHHNPQSITRILSGACSGSGTPPCFNFAQYSSTRVKHSL
ncbi:hypothetical protein [Acetobacter lambici]|uniref:hypothetical protein n=1 Tax=Acetobacter lambici TaxID=1332824 RepID=UPI0020A2F222|nr:hypothetical protein [Acetobacter lambici]MCP1243585.1 hypothetical protein [Acetobacter lambici]